MKAFYSENYLPDHVFPTKFDGIFQLNYIHKMLNLTLQKVLKKEQGFVVQFAENRQKKFKNSISAEAFFQKCLQNNIPAKSPVFHFRLLNDYEIRALKNI